MCIQRVGRILKGPWLHSSPGSRKHTNAKLTLKTHWRKWFSGRKKSSFGCIKVSWNKFSQTNWFFLSEPIVGKDYVSLILGSIQGALPPTEKRAQMSSNELDKCVMFVSDVAILLFREMKVLRFLRLQICL